jgi:hypothetical protein
MGLSSLFDGELLRDIPGMADVIPVENRISNNFAQ